MRAFMRSSAHIRLTAVGRAARNIANTASSDSPCLRREHHAPGCGDADRGRATDGQILDRLSHLGGIGAVEPALFLRQQALVQQAQMIALPLHGADAVVTVVIHVSCYSMKTKNGLTKSGRRSG